MEKNRFHLITLGCPKNIVDSEMMAALLKERGLLDVEKPDEADLIIINTCCFIEAAKEEAIRTILDTAGIREETGAFLIVTGCLPQRYKDEIADALPEVDSWMGLEDLSKIADLAEQTLAGKQIRMIYNAAPRKFEDLPRRFTPHVPYSYLKIAEGCSHSCAFCIIPSIRGGYRSLPMESVMKNARAMIAAGHREIVLIAQDTSLYGIDLYGKPMLSELMKRLTDIPDLEWLRLMYVHPGTLSDDILKVIAENKAICPYIDIPLQHSHPDILKKMGRPHEEKHVRGIIEKIRSYLPDASIRTAFIVGHPGETEKRFLDLVRFVRESRFYHMGVFTYSPEEGTSSAALKTRPSRAIALERQEYLMGIQQEIAEELRREKIGTTLPAVCEYVIDPDKTGRDDDILLVHMEGAEVKESSRIPPGTTAIGRTIYDAPDIDSLIFITGTPPPPEGTFFNAKITGMTGYDLTGRLS